VNRYKYLDKYVTVSVCVLAYSYCNHTDVVYSVLVVVYWQRSYSLEYLVYFTRIVYCVKACPVIFYT